MPQGKIDDKDSKKSKDDDAKAKSKDKKNAKALPRGSILN